MTREEAIYRLKNMAWLYGSVEREQNIEAVDMAIKALSADTSSDLISRTDAIEAVRSYFKDRLGKSKCDYDEELQLYVLGKEERTMLTYNKGINDKLRSLPSADAVQGEWILVKGSNGKDYHKCSKCLHTQEITGVKNYCAVCGARMKGGAE